MKQLLSEISQASLNLVFPIYCEGCDSKLSYDNKRYLCQDCLGRIKKNSPPFCIRCGRCLGGEDEVRTICPDCINKSFYFDAAWQCCRYDGLIRELIHNFKYNRKLFLKDTLTEILYSFAGLYIDNERLDIILPVPMHQTCINKRGFNQSALLSRQLSKLLSIPYIGDCLIKIKNTKQQAALNKKERLNNTKDAFSIKKDVDIASKNILLIDDVFTTGATANECSRVLKEAGADSISVLALARGI